MTREVIEELLEQALQENHFDDDDETYAGALNGIWNRGAGCLADRFLAKVIRYERDKEGDK